MSEHTDDLPEVDLTEPKVQFVLSRMRHLRGEAPMRIDDPLRRAVIALCHSWLAQHGEPQA